MILVISTSSRFASLAWFQGPSLVWSSRREAPRSASQAVLEMRKESGISLSSAQGIASDVGPGSMTGVKVGVTLAKTWGFALGLPCAGLTAFDLISPHEPVIVAVRRNESWLRIPGEPPRLLTDHELQEVKAPPTALPDAAMAGPLMESLSWLKPEELLPLYLSDPLISHAKKRLTLVEPPR